MMERVTAAGVALILLGCVAVLHTVSEDSSPRHLRALTTMTFTESADCTNHKEFQRDDSCWSDPTYVKDFCEHKLETFIASGHFSYINWEDDMGSGKCWNAPGLTWYQQGIVKKQEFYCQSHTTSFEGNCWNLNSIVPGYREWRKVFCDNKLKSYDGFELPLGHGDLPLGHYGDSERCWTEETIINDKPQANWYQDGIMKKIKDWCDKHPEALDKNNRQYNSQCGKK